MTSPPESLADALFSRTRKAAIGLLFAQPQRAVHLRELARLAAVSPAMMAKELDSLCAAGMVLQRRDGNRRLFSANPACPIFDELAGIARKTAGLADVLRQALAGVDGIALAFVFGSVARATARADSDIDLWVIGNCDYSALLQACAVAQQRLARPVSPVLYAPAELAALKADPDNAFLAEVRRQPRLALIGSEDDIAGALGQPGEDR